MLTREQWKWTCNTRRKVNNVNQTSTLVCRFRNTLMPAWRFCACAGVFVLDTRGAREAFRFSARLSFVVNGFNPALRHTTLQKWVLTKFWMPLLPLSHVPRGSPFPAAESNLGGRVKEQLKSKGRGWFSHSRVDLRVKQNNFVMRANLSCFHRQD